MGKRRIPSDTGHGPTPSPLTAEAWALEYFFSRTTAGVYASRPPIERWRPDQRERFEAEIRRLEGQAARHETIGPRDEAIEAP